LSHFAEDSALSTDSLSVAVRAINEMAAERIRAIQSGSIEDYVTVACQLEFDRCAHLGMFGFYSYEIRRAQWMQHLKKTRGRKRSADVTLALDFEDAGVSRKDIYARLGKATPSEQHALREAMRQRKRRQRLAQASSEE
jgi:hypothetical protein